VDSENLQKYRFGPFLLDPSEGKLLRDGQVITLTPKAFEALVLLVQRQGRLIVKEELISLLWPDTFVEEANLAHHIWRLRKALDDTKDDARYIETVPKRGYRFVARVEQASDYIDVANPETSSTDLAPNSDLDSSAASGLDGLDGGMTRKWPRAAALAGVIVVLLTAPIAFLKFLDRDHSAALADTQTISTLAVLPFKPLTTEEADPSLQLGVADGVIARLSNLKELTVRPTSAVIKYASQPDDLDAVARELKVDSVLEGTIQRADDRLRVSVQLIRSEDKKTIWAEHFDEKAADILALQDSVSERVARALAVKLTRSESDRLQQHETTNVEAYQSYLKGRYQMNMGAEGNLKATASFQDAIYLDPNFAKAYAARSRAFSTLAFMGVGGTPNEQFDNARSSALKAMELDSSLADAHTALAQVLFTHDWKFESAEREFNRALELNPNLSEGHHLYSEYLQAMNRWDEGLAEIRRAQELDPMSLEINFHYALCLAGMNRDDEALAQYRKTLDIDSTTGASGSHWGIAQIYLKRGLFDDAIRELEEAQRADPRPSWRKLNLAEAYARAGRRKEALALVGDIVEMQKREWVSPSGLALVYAALGEKDKAFKWWNKAIDERETHVVYLKALPLQDVREDPRFSDLLRRVGLDP
jgi:DNA-binding winged helix-turn-helix (wHTH) protein/TolB-like protein/Flp pilus assembly protein TadD